MAEIFSVCGTGTSVDRAGLTAWTNPGNITVADANLATCNGAGSDYLVGSNFDFSTLPNNAIILGIQVGITASEHSGGTEALLAQLQDQTGTLFGSSKSAANEGVISGTAQADYSYGLADDLWGATLTPAIVKDPDFGVRLWFTTSHDVRVGVVNMTVFYTVAGAPDDSEIEPAGGAIEMSRRAMMGALATATFMASVADSYKFNDDILPPPPIVEEDPNITIRTKSWWYAPVWIGPQGGAVYITVTEDEYQPPPPWPVKYIATEPWLGAEDEVPSQVVDEESELPQVIWPVKHKWLDVVDEEFVTPVVTVDEDYLVPQIVWPIYRNIQQDVVDDEYNPQIHVFEDEPFTPQVTRQYNIAPSFIADGDYNPQLHVFEDEWLVPQVVWPNKITQISFIDEEIVPQPAQFLVEDDAFIPQIIWPQKFIQNTLVEDEYNPQIHLWEEEDQTPKIVWPNKIQPTVIIDEEFVQSAPQVIVEDEVFFPWTVQPPKIQSTTLYQQDEWPTPLNVDELYDIEQIVAKYKGYKLLPNPLFDEAIWVAPPFVPLGIDEDYFPPLPKPRLWWTPPPQSFTDTDPKVPQTPSGTIRLEGIATEVLYLVPPQPVRVTTLHVQFMGFQPAKARSTWITVQAIGFDSVKTVRSTFLHVQFIGFNEIKTARLTFVHVQLMRDKPGPPGEPEPEPEPCPETPIVEVESPITPFECVQITPIVCEGLQPEVRIVVPEEICPPIQGEPIPPSETPPEEPPIAVGSLIVSNPIAPIMEVGESFEVEVLVMSVEFVVDGETVAPKPLPGRRVEFVSLNPAVATVRESDVTNGSGIAKVPVTAVGPGSYTITTKCEGVIGDTLTGQVVAVPAPSITGIGRSEAGASCIGAGTVVQLAPGQAASEVGATTDGVGTVAYPPAFGAVSAGATSDGAGLIINPVPPQPPINGTATAFGGASVDGTGTVTLPQAGEAQSFAGASTNAVGTVAIPAGFAASSAGASCDGVGTVGMTLLLHYNCTSISPATPGTWYNATGSWVTVSTISDPTAPESPSGVIRHTFPSGQGSGNFPAWQGNFAPQTEIIFEFVIKLSNPWTQHPSGVDKLFFVNTNQSETGNEVVVALRSGQIRVACQDPDGDYRTANVSQPGFSKGVWHRIKVHLKGSTGGLSNGLMEWWVDGQLVGRHTDVRFHSTGDAVFNFVLNQHYWGGDPSVGTKPQTEFIDDDDIKVWGISATQPPPITIAAVNVTPASFNGVVGGNIILSANPVDASGNHVVNRQVGWQSSNPVVASVSPDSGDENHRTTATFNGPGPVIIAATCEGKVGSSSGTVVAAGYTEYFREDWSTGNKNRNQGGFRWGGASGGSGGDAIPAVTTLNPMPGRTHSLQFQYGGNANLLDDAWSEQRFVLGQNLTDIYFLMWMYFPDGTEGLGSARFEHRWPGELATNNKLFLLWDLEYGNYHVAVTNHYRTTQTLTPDSYYDPNIGVKLKSGAQSGVGPHGIMGGGQVIINDSLRGRWSKWQWHIKVGTFISNPNATSLFGLSGDGISELWIDGILVHSKHNLPLFSPFIGANNFFKNGYILGWANSGFTQTTRVWVGDVVMASGYIED